MTDVRLTALNPEDSKVYPVACNSSGELLTTKVGNDVVVPGDLTVGGEAEFESTLSVGNPTTNQFGTQIVSGGINIYGEASYPGEMFTLRQGSGTTVQINADGSGSLANGLFNLSANGGLRMGSVGTENGVTLSLVAGTNPAPSAYTLIQGLQSNGITQAFEFKADGSTTFSGGKAGFTADGYLWCTTRRGDTVILDATSNGLATWADYTPPTRREQLQENVEEIKEELEKGDESPESR